jgi:hypothetical protein
MRDDILAFMKAHKLTIESTFVPFSQSRNKAEKYRSLNWRTRLMKGEREIWAGDYSAGAGHCPCNKNKRNADKYITAVAEKYETENGRAARILGNMVLEESRKPIFPDSCDVLYSLASDASALDSPTYEDWAGEFGYDVDSRKGESIYRACLESALKLRAALGEAGLEALRAAVQDY